jgi:hypothetical protein
MDAIINVTELACDLAERSLKEFCKANGVDPKSMYETKEDGSEGYVEAAQDQFNEMNDLWEDIIMKSEVKIPSARINWYKSDIESLGYKCTDEQAEEVLYLAENNHDATVGINWEVLEEWCEYVGLQRKEELE